MIHSTLSQYFYFYNLLSDADKMVFQKRVQDFIKGRLFISRLAEREVADEIKILVAAVAIQITFGLRKYMFPHFNTIIIYPESYFSHINKRYHKGEINLQGAIVISLKDFLLGLKDPHDSFNIGIHEFAHAVYFENYIQNEDYLFIDGKIFDDWFSTAEKAIPVIANELNSFIRDYAYTNKQEFFAVCAEYFFEMPETFKKLLPDLYIRLTKVFNQDPVEIYSKAKEKGLL